MSVILDTGAFAALERDDRAIWRRQKEALQLGSPLMTHGGVVAQVWRDGAGRQALLARALQAVETIPLDERLGGRAGALLSRSGCTDAVDAALAAMADHCDQIITSDPADLVAPVAASTRRRKHPSPQAPVAASTRRVDIVPI